MRLSTITRKDHKVAISSAATSLVNQHKRQPSAARLQRLFFGIALAITTTLCWPTAYADNLVQIYHQALKSDPSFKQSYSNWLSAEQNLPLSKTNLHPMVDISAGVSPNYQWLASHHAAGSSHASGGAWVGSPAGNFVQVSLSQTLFDAAAWKQINGAEFSVKAATAQYLASAQDLMARTATAYFNVLSASEQLQYIVAQKKAMLQQLMTERQKFKVGLIAITGVYDARAKYDASVAEQIKTQHLLANQLENLRAITGTSYHALASLEKNVPLRSPQPNHIDAWVTTANQHNYAIQALVNTMLAKKEAVKQALASRYPTLKFSAQAAANMSGYLPTTTPSPTPSNHGIIQSSSEQVSAGLTLNFPVYQGGAISASATQKNDDYLSATHMLEQTRREVEKNTRQAYLGVNASISQIKADQQSMLSANQQLQATKASYQVGTRTMVDVLDGLSLLYKAREAWAQDRYTYIINLIKLKQSAGTLSPKDLIKINAWLSHTTQLDPEAPIKMRSLEPIQLSPSKKSTHLPKKTSPKTMTIPTPSLQLAQNKVAIKSNVHRHIPIPLQVHAAHLEVAHRDGDA